VLDVALGSISRVKKMGHSNVKRGGDSYGIQIKCKDMRKIVFYHNPENHSRRLLFDNLRLYAFPNSNKMVRAIELIEIQLFLAFLCDAV
jgi:hypothetical protein